MGTRSLTHIYKTSASRTPFLTFYRQYDGYPSGIGEDIKRVLGQRKLVNGFNDPATQCNGIECAAALLVGELKGGRCGGVYIHEAGASDLGEEFTYNLYPAGEGFRLVIREDNSLVYDGSLHEFDSSLLPA